ncbi:MAG: GreA/GreB family elongation factor [Candidatus Absconditabacteria bacterium]|nr:GreA/GreB family elongation factor [Candidatus Absconditabacteria bacterium]
MSTKINYLTREGYERLVQELHDLKKIELPKILERLSDAKAMGDLSENFEYKSALEDKDFAQTRINEIEELIHNVEIIKEEKKTSKKTDKTVDYGTKVTVSVEGDKEYTVDIVGTGETGIDGKNLKISLESPLGLAIKGKKIGEIGKMKLATGKVDVKIVNIQ